MTLSDFSHSPVRTDSQRAAESVAAPPGKFVIFCYPRTGSYHLVSLLNSCSDVVCHGEVFKRDRVEIDLSRMQDLGRPTLADRNADPGAFLDKLRNLDKGKIFGFKLFLDHSRKVPQLRSLLGDRSWRKLILVRDPIEVHASLLRANRTKIWTRRAGRPVDEDTLHAQVTFEPAQLRRFFYSYSRFLEVAGRLATQQHGFVITYNELNSTAARRLMLRYIGSTCPPEALESDYKKQFEKPSSEAFTNWAELQSFLAANPAPLLPPSSIQRRRSARRAGAGEKAA